MTPVSLPRRPRTAAAIPLTPLVDVLLILLIFFMVTSTYLDLDMIPMAETGDAPAAAAPPADAEPAGAAPDRTVLVRLDETGVAIVAGTRLDDAALAAEIAARLAAHPQTPVLILPSPRASIQALVDLLAAVAEGGAAQVSVVRFDDTAAP